MLRALIIAAVVLMGITSAVYAEVQISVGAGVNEQIINTPGGGGPPPPATFLTLVGGGFIDLVGGGKVQCVGSC